MNLIGAVTNAHMDHPSFVFNSLCVPQEPLSPVFPGVGTAQDPKPLIVNVPDMYVCYLRPKTGSAVSARSFVQLVSSEYTCSIQSRFFLNTQKHHQSDKF